jgi:hypothetical protein
MKTDELVALLSTNPEPIDRRSVARTLQVALAAGSFVSLGKCARQLSMKKPVRKNLTG